MCATAFLKAMRESLNDDTCRLAFADWLDENDGSELAARLRWQSEARTYALTHCNPPKPGAERSAQALATIYRNPPEWVFFNLVMGRMMEAMYPEGGVWGGIEDGEDITASPDRLYARELYALGIISRPTWEDADPDWTHEWEPFYVRREDNGWGMHAAGITESEEEGERTWAAIECLAVAYHGFARDLPAPGWTYLEQLAPKLGNVV